MVGIEVWWEAALLQCGIGCENEIGSVIKEFR